VPTGQVVVFLGTRFYDSRSMGGKARHEHISSAIHSGAGVVSQFNTFLLWRRPDRRGDRSEAPGPEIILRLIVAAARPYGSSITRVR
jgi:hypothetical protein